MKHALRRRTLLLFSAPLFLLPAGAAPPPLALVTILDGEATLLRGGERFALAEGLRLQADDLLELGDKARLLRIEYPDGTSLSLGPLTRALLGPQQASSSYLLRGWAKLAVASKAAPGALATPLLGLSGVVGSAVVAVLPEGAQVFAETGPLQLTRPTPQTLKPGEWLAIAPDAKIQRHTGPSAAFIQQVPRPFLDALPARAALFSGKAVEPKRVGDITYADAQPWLDAPDPALRRLALNRWKPLARHAEFRRALVADLKAHPEWEPVLFPPAPPASAASRY